MTDLHNRLYRRSRSDNPVVAFPALVRLGKAQAIAPSTDTGYKAYGEGKLFLPAATNLCVDPCCSALTFWPADTAHTDLTAGVSNPLPTAGVPSTVLSLVNDGTADAPQTANITVSASTAYMASIYVYAPTLGGNLTITTEDGHSFTLAALTGVVGAWRRYNIASPTVAGEVTLSLKFSFAGGGVSTVYVTGCNVIATSVLTPYFDGSSPDCVWTGTANASTSTRTVSGHNIYVLTNTWATACTIAYRTAPLFAGNDGVLQNQILLYVGAADYIYLAKDAANKWSVKVQGSAGSAGVTYGLSAAQSFAANTFHSIVARIVAGSTIDLDHDGTSIAQVANPRTPTAFASGRALGTSLGYVGPVIISPARKSDAWTAAVQVGSGAIYSDPMRVWREYLEAGDLFVPFQNDSVSFLKI